MGLRPGMFQAKERMELVMRSPLWLGVLFTVSFLLIKHLLYEELRGWSV